MRGRTNVGGGGVGIYADTENFTVAEGSNVTAGNFVQYKMEGDDRKYDTNVGLGNNFFGSENQAPKVLPCGNNRYVRRYKNNNEENITWFNLVDVTDEFSVLSSFSINSENLPAFCILDDGNIAVSYMKENNTITVEIYSTLGFFTKLSTYQLTNENIGNVGNTHITQLGNSKILVNNLNNFFICTYLYGEITENKYASVEKKQLTFAAKALYDNDWNIYSSGKNAFILFQAFYSVKNTLEGYYCVLVGEEEGNLEEIDSESISFDINNQSQNSLNTCLWGNAFGINGKVLFSEGDAGRYDIRDAFETKIYYCKDVSIMQSSVFNPMKETESEGIFELSSGIDTFTSTSGTAQYVKEDVIYVAVCPQGTYLENNQSGAIRNEKNKTAIYRAEYNPNNGIFKKSNTVTFETEGIYENGAYRGAIFSGFGQFFESENGDVYYLYETSANTRYKKSGRWLMKLSYKDGVLSIGESTGLVENYNGSGAAIGVAKQSGSAGQEVEVYVPKV